MITTNLFPAVIKAICAYTNATGALVYEHESNSNIIQECASEKGITNLTGLSLAFNWSNSTLQVISGSNHTVICTPFTFSGGLAITNTNNTIVELQKFVFVETNTLASGILSATEMITRGASNQLTGFSLHGLLDYSVAANGTNAAKICRGMLLVGDAIVASSGGTTGDQDGEENENDDNDEDGGQGNNGHHGHGNSGNNGKHLGQLKH
jgi:hypothetical protein